MKDSYDFSKGRRGRVAAEPPLESGKVRITIRLDEDLVDYFGTIADRSGGKVGYQTSSARRWPETALLDLSPPCPFRGLLARHPAASENYSQRTLGRSRG
jgi:hypothetical protein